MDYGKIAYLQAQELNKRLSNYIINQDKSYYQSIVQTKNAEITTSLNYVEFSFISCGYACTQLFGNLCSQSQQVIKVNYLINGADCGEIVIDCKTGQSYAFNFAKSVNVVGLCVVKAVFTVSGNASLNNVVLVASGKNLSYGSSFSSIGASKNNNDCFYAVATNNKLSIFTNDLVNCQVYDHTQRIDKLKLFFLGSKRYVFFTSLGVLRVAEITLNGIQNIKEIYQSVADYDIANTSSGIAVYLCVRNNLYQGLLDQQFVLGAISKVDLGGKVSSCRAYVEGNEIFLAIEQYNSKLVKSSQINSNFQKIADLPNGKIKGIAKVAGKICIATLNNSVCQLSSLEANNTLTASQTHYLFDCALIEDKLFAFDQDTAKIINL